MTPQARDTANPRSGLIRLGVLGLVNLAAAVTPLSPRLASTTTFPQALAKPSCAADASRDRRRRTGAGVGRVPASDYTSGRYRASYRCNTVQVSHQVATGGFKVERYVDTSGHVCASSTWARPRTDARTRRSRSSRR